MRSPVYYRKNRKELQELQEIYHSCLSAFVLCILFVIMSPTFFPEVKATFKHVVSSSFAIVTAVFELGIVIYRSYFVFVFVVADCFRMLRAFRFKFSKYPFGCFSFMNDDMICSISSSMYSLLQIRKPRKNNPKTTLLMTLSLCPE